MYGGELLPEDRYEEWAEERREQLRLRHLDLLRLDGRWETVVELDPSDELAHLALMRRHAANGDRHAALRQFERMDRTLRRELGVAPGREALALRDRLLAEHDVVSAPRRRADRPRRRARRSPSARCSTPRPGRSRTLIVERSGRRRASRRCSPPSPRGRRSSASASATERRRRSRARGRTRRSSRRSPTCAGVIRRCSTASPIITGKRSTAPSPARRSRGPAESSHQRLFVAAAELVRLASATNGLLLTIDDVHDADDASLRLAALHRPFDARPAGVHRAHAPAGADRRDTLAETRQSLIDRHGAIELELGPLGDDDIAALVRRHVAEPTAELVEQIAALGGASRSR